MRAIGWRNVTSNSAAAPSGLRLARDIVVLGDRGRVGMPYRSTPADGEGQVSGEDLPVAGDELLRDGMSTP